jgi:hypothetical protein
VSLVRLLMRVVGEVGAPPQKNPCLGFALGPSLNPVVRSHGLHGTTPPYIYGPSRAKTKWNGSWTGWFIIFRPNSHENIGHFEPDPKNGMLPSPARGAHPLPKASSALVLHRVKAQKSMPFAQDQHEVHGSCSRNCCGGALEAPSPLSPPPPPQTHGAKGTTPDLFFLVPQSQKQPSDCVVQTLVFHGTTPPYIYGPSRAKTKWNGFWTGWFIIFRPNSHENIGHFEPDPKNGMLPSHISLDFPRNYGPVHGGHPSPYIFRFPRLGIVMRGSCIMTLWSGRGLGGGGGGCECL